MSDPAIRDYDGSIYIREWNGGILCGGFQTFAKPIFHTGIPSKFEFQLLPEDWDNFREFCTFRTHFETHVHIGFCYLSLSKGFGFWLFFFG